MNKKYIFGGAIIIVFLGLMGYLATQSSIGYESDFSKVMTMGKTVKATGKWMKEKHFEIDNTTKTFSFFMQDDHNNTMQVKYHGTMPNNFEMATSIVVTGKYENGVFHAKDILTKSPSKYQDQKSANS